MYKEKIKIVDKNGLIGYYLYQEVIQFGSIYQGCVIHLHKEPYVVEMLEVMFDSTVVLKVRKLRGF